MAQVTMLPLLLAHVALAGPMLYPLPVAAPVPAVNVTPCTKASALALVHTSAAFMAIVPAAPGETSRFE